MSERSYNEYIFPLRPHIPAIERGIVIVRAPAFPAFLTADFETHTGFLGFIDLFGLEGFEIFDSGQKQRPGNLGAEIKKVYKGESSCLSEAYVKEVFARIKRGLLDEQRTMRFFYHWLLHNPWPNLEIPLPPLEGSEDDMLTRIVDATEKAAKETRVAIDYDYPEVIDEQGAPLLDERGRPLVGREDVAVFKDHRFDSITARCYIEMIEARDDDKKIALCENCLHAFFPTRKDEVFCRGYDPESLKAYKEGLPEGVYPRGAPPSGKVKTCKDVGPQKRFRERAEEEGRAEYIKEDKRFRSRLDYLKKKGDEEGYRKVLEQYERFKKEKRGK